MLQTPVDHENARPAPSWQPPSQGRTLRAWAPPAPIAPLSDGDEAASTTQQVLLAATRLSGIRLNLRAGQGQWSWQGCLDDSFEQDGKLILHAANMMVVVDPADVIAVSYCADRDSSGVTLSDTQGELLTLWSTDTQEFDAWLAALAPTSATVPSGQFEPAVSAVS